MQDNWRTLAKAKSTELPAKSPAYSPADSPTYSPRSSEVWRAGVARRVRAGGVSWGGRFLPRGTWLEWWRLAVTSFSGGAVIFFPAVFRRGGAGGRQPPRTRRPACRVKVEQKKGNPTGRRPNATSEEPTTATQPATPRTATNQPSQKTRTTTTPRTARKPPPDRRPPARRPTGPGQGPAKPGGAGPDGAARLRVAPGFGRDASSQPGRTPPGASNPGGLPRPDTCPPCARTWPGPVGRRAVAEGARVTAGEDTRRVFPAGGCRGGGGPPDSRHTREAGASRASWCT